MGLLDRWKKQQNVTNDLHESLASMYKQILKQVTKNEQEILQFLEFSSQLYKYDLESALFAYGQNPNAKFLADFDTWKSIGRSVTRGSKAIKVLHQKENGLFYHVNLFDVAQTTGREFPFPVWLMNATQYKAVTDHAFQVSNDSIDGLWDGIVTEYSDKRATSDLTEDSFQYHEEVSEFMLKYKLGQFPRWKDYIDIVQPFVRNPELFIAAVPKIIEANRSLLAQIDQAKRELLSKENDNAKQFRSTQSISRENEPTKSSLQTTNKTNRSTGLPGRERPTVSENNANGREPRTEQTRNDDSGISEGESSSSVSRVVSERRIDDLSEEQGRTAEDERTEDLPRATSTESGPITDRTITTNPNNQPAEGTSTRNGTEGSSSALKKGEQFSYKEIVSVDDLQKVSADTSPDLAEWTELPETYRFQRLNNKAYLINEKGEFEIEPVEITYDNGKTYYRQFVKAAAGTSKVEQSAEGEIDLFDFQYTEAQQDTVKTKDSDKQQAAQELLDFSFNQTDDFLYSKKPKQRLADNLAALRLLKQLEKENRLATADEQAILARYVGWGGLSEIFNMDNDNYAKERRELKELVTAEEYESARESVLTAYYTDPMIIEQIYETVERLGFKNGRILDPAMGTGNFFSAMPAKMKQNSQLYGVELDRLSAAISKQLQQSVHIQEKGFEETQFIDGSFDLVVANVPFSDFRIKDKKTLDSYYVHDYFIKHSLDLVHEGGIVAVITSSGTLDKKDSYFRKELATQAELLGAVRLPETAFKAIAGTEVTTDILFFRKEAAELKRDYGERSWETTVDIENHQRFEDGSLYPPITVNKFYSERWSSILGEFKYKNFRGGTYTVVPQENSNLSEQLRDRLRLVKGEYIPPVELSYKVPEVLPLIDEETPSFDQEQLPLYSYFEKEGEIYYHGNGDIEKISLGETRKKRMLGMIEIRDRLSEVISYQQQYDFNQAVFSDTLSELNRAYDEFLKKYGPINSQVNSRLFYEDDRYALLSSIEIPQKNGSYTKGDVFRKATIRQIEPVTKVNSAIEALNHSLSKLGRVDIGYMLSIYPVEEAILLEQLDGHIFIDAERYLQADKQAENAYVPKEEYLSGDVKHKLSLAKMLVGSDGRFEKNIAALQEVIPKDLTISEIEYDIGASWIPVDTYHAFMKDVFDTAPFKFSRKIIKVEYNQYTDTYHINGKKSDNSVLVNNEYGTSRINAYQILEKSLNLKTVQIFDKEEVWLDGERVTKDVLNMKETMLARSKQEHIHHAFKGWLFQDSHRAEELLRIYNDRFNRIRPRQYDGSYLSFEGMNEQFELRPHQKNVVARIVENGRALMAHEVGAGKTASMISAGMMMKDQGLIKKPMYVVPNHLTEQFGQELLRFYPSKKVLITGKKDFEKKNRQKFVSRIATGDYDAIIIGHSQFEKVPLSKERRTALIKRELSELEEGIRLEKSENGQTWSLKQMVSFEKRLKERLKNLQNEEYKDRLLTFEELGVDFLFVDEAHNYKNLYSYTKMSNVAGVNTSNSLRATDMFMKCQYMLEKFQNRGVVFATGTPISNSMSELYTMQRYLQPEELSRMNLHTFDRWASTFGEVVTAPEINPEGSGFRMKSRFAKFHNLPELMSSFHLTADIQTSDMLNLPVPKIATGKPQLVISEPSTFQEKKMTELAERADAVRLGQVNPREDNMLKITNEAKLMAIDPRLLEPDAPIHTDGKLFKCAENVHEIWRGTSEKKSTQIIFSDSGTPNPNKFNVYDEMKRVLIEKGIPEKEIAFIHSAKNDRQRDELFEKVRNGEVRIIFGSTEKLGTGTNIQDKLIAVHHLDVPWRPSDLTQRDGRGVRQGNENPEVHIYRYVARDSFDAYLWQTQENKLKFINQIMTGKSIARSADDIDQSTLDAAEAKALATNNPMLIEKMAVDRDVMNLQLLKSSWQSSHLTLTHNLENVYPKQLEDAQINLEKTTQDNEWAAKQLNGEFSMKLLDQVYNDRSEALEVFNSIIETGPEMEGKIVGSMYGFELKIVPSRFGQTIVSLERERSYTVAVEKNGKGSLTRMTNVLRALPEKINDLKNEIEELVKKMDQAQQQVNKPFEQDKELNQLLEKQTAINLSLEMGEQDLSAQEQPIVEVEISESISLKNRGNTGMEQER
ncbi:helicase [Enterococcus pallens ATCC BAA-351]|uniref:Helicase n=1 Tax=Enterococcus pallens ATCC BAA-351 TaxID=1158607 RepID=R2PSQ4_9ENTE|nr:N-6 DNA methylase [Enterococcus pallens]EOH86333.1 helicase [Enterococcus pallens ATCC BAA-351]EOU09446.1 helicase [Enterococcus pallens ATCC BAA-351]OJG77557.1 helicase [Enterococcus pallens]